MTKILQFPGGGNSPTASGKSANDDSAAAPQQQKHTKAASFAKGLIEGLWVLAVLTWPLLRTVFALDLVFQFVRMLWHWNSPGLHAGAVYDPDCE